MSACANRTRGAVPTRIVAAAAALAMLAVPLPAAADGPPRTVLLTLTGDTTLTQLADSVSAAGGRVIETLGLADSLLVELPAKAVLPAGSAEMPDVAMTVNSTSRTDENATTSTYLETIGVEPDSARGAGTTIALVDTGVADVPDLDDVTHLAVKGVGTGDGYGHGTFLAGIIAGDGAQMGVAPGADLLDVKVANDEGETSLSKVLAGLELVAKRDVDVLNLSLSTESPLPPSFDPLARALERLWDKGVTVVVAAGNEGPEWGTVGSPGNHPLLLTVGALDEGSLEAGRGDDSVAGFSARGSVFASGKPDLVAPGVSLVSTMAPGSEAAAKTVWNDGTYMRGSGTSMSAAVATGAAAAVLAENEALEPNGVKAVLTASAYGNGALTVETGAGAGGLDLSAALEAAGDPQTTTNPAQPEPDVPTTPFGPSEADAVAWAAFAQAWEADDWAAVQAAWKELSPRTKIWAARAWAVAVLASSLRLDDDDFASRIRSAHEWSAEKWLGRAWSGRAWSDEEWLGRAWSGRAWSDEAWLGRAWSGRAWSMADWAGRAWSGRAWSGFDWEGRAWSGRAWSGRAWSGRAWSYEEWIGRAWSGRAWSGRAWSGRAWSDFAWGTRAWSGRAWSTEPWTTLT